VAGDETKYQGKGVAVMPIAGFVISVDPDKTDIAAKEIDKMECAEVHGKDSSGNIVTVLDCHTSDEMEAVVKEISSIDGVFSAGLTYFNAEDEVERMERGEYIPSRSFGNRVDAENQT
jgi:nitrate reductase NapAB chaperone NapD